MDKITFSLVIPHPPQVNAVQEQVPFKTERVKTSGAQVTDMAPKVNNFPQIGCDLPLLTFLSIFHHQQ